MRLGAFVLLVFMLFTGTAQAQQKIDYDVPATNSDFHALYISLGNLQTTVDVAKRTVDWRWNKCRFQTLEKGVWTYTETVKTIRCAAEKLDPIGGLTKALDVWHCESGWGMEPSRDRYSSYHGPYQFLTSTFSHAYWGQDGLRKTYRLKDNVHNARSNIFAALGTARYSWSAWACA